MNFRIFFANSNPGEGTVALSGTVSVFSSIMVVGVSRDTKGFLSLLDPVVPTPFSTNMRSVFLGDLLGVVGTSQVKIRGGVALGALSDLEVSHVVTRLVPDAV